MTQPPNPTAPPADPASPPPAPVATTTPTPAAPAAANDVATELAAIKAEAEKWKHFSRENETKFKTTSAELDTQKGILKQLAEKAGIQIDGTPDPVKLAEQLTAAQMQRQAAATELAVYKAAAGAGGNADLLLDSRSFMAQASQLDTSAADYDTQLKTLVTQHVTANPTLAAAQAAATPAQPATPAPQAPTSSGGNFQGAPGTARQWTEADVEAATPAQLNKAIQEGLLTNIGIGRPKSSRR